MNFSVYACILGHKVRICVLYRLLYRQDIGETKQFSRPNPHVKPQSDVGAVTQIDMRKKETNKNGTEQGNGMGKGRGTRGSQ